jgi:hypothetical protein
VATAAWAEASVEAASVATLVADRDATIACIAAAAAFVVPAAVTDAAGVAAAVCMLTERLLLLLGLQLTKL